jgi:predicted nucleotidyltransferase
MLAREGELIKTENQVIFDVKGVVHPPNRLIAFPRYIPSPQGTRQGKKGLYGKIYSFSERFQFLEQNMPDLIVHDPVFDETLCEVPIDMVVERYNPVEKLRVLRASKELDDLERKVVHLTEELHQASGIPWSSIGISGSVLTGLYTLQSDVDPVVYGEENGRMAYVALENLLKDNSAGFKQYTQGELQTLFDFRSKDTIMRFEDFARVERRKGFQGKFDGVDYFLRFVKDWNENREKYGNVHYRNHGYVEITGTIIDDSEALFTPCMYKLEEVKVIDGLKLEPITEVVSFRGRFCLQARTGETVVVQGKVEHARDTRSKSEHYRVIIGNKPSDYMVLSET